MIIYLYVKQHAVTGLKYFGKTKKTDPFKYLGSGLYWKKHIKKHGKKYVKTIDIWGFDCENLCSDFALMFSKLHNIVESDEWANLKEENGLDGGFNAIMGTRSKRFKGKTHSNESRQKMTASKVGDKNPNYGKTHSDETRNKMKIKSAKRQITRPREEIINFAKCNLGRKQTAEHIKNRTANTKGRFAIVNKEGVVRYTKNSNDERLLSGEFIKGKLWIN